MGTRVRRTLALLLAAAGCATGVAYATGAIGSDGGAIVGCAKDQNGQLRVVSQASDCLPSEHVVLLGTPQGAPGPASVFVDCAAGQTIGDALQQTASATSVDITVKGTCTETVGISRDHVSLHGGGPGDGLAAPAPDAPVLKVEAARYVRLDTLTLRGGRWGLIATDGASVNASNLAISGIGGQDVLSLAGATLNLSNSTITGGDEGVSANSGGSVGVDGGTISGAQSAVHAHEDGSIVLAGGVVVTDAGFHAVVAQDGGSVLLQSATVENSGGTGVFAFQGGSVFVTRDALVQNNRFGGVGANAGVAEVDGHVTHNQGVGVFGYNGGHITIQDGALVDENDGDGVQAGVGSTVVVQGATIRDNTTAGIHLTGTASAAFGGGNVTITGNGWWGVFCDGPPSVAQLQTSGSPNVNVSGNAAGQIDCPTT